jgi:phage shock protein A
MRVKAYTARTGAYQRPRSLPTAERRAEIDKAELDLYEATATVERLEREGRRLQAEAATLFDRAMDEREAGRHDAAEEVLARRSAIAPELDALEVQHAEAKAEQARLEIRLDDLRG